MTNCIEHKKLSEEQLEELISIIRDRQKKICTKCACPLNPSKQKKYLGICSNKDCKYSQRSFQSTIFSGSKLDRITFMRVLELWCMKALHIIIAYCLGISRQAVTSVIRRLKAEIKYKNDTCADKIGGDGVIVEIDESKFGKRKYNRGHRVEGVWVFGMVERSAERKIKLVVVDDRKAETLMESLTKFVDTSSIIHSDQWKGYKDVVKTFANHLTVNHRKHYVDPLTGTHSNTIEGNCNGIKMHIPSRHRSKDRINMYITRFMLGRNYACHPLVALINYLN